MAITVRTRKLLWSKSANRCNIEDCRDELCIESDADGHTIVGEECHIVAKSERFVRGKSDLSSSERDLYDNLILLCKKHHKEIDNWDNEKKYSVEFLKKLKCNHENWVRETLSKKKIKKKEFYFDEDIIFDEQYISEVAEWIIDNTRYDYMVEEKVKSGLSELSYLNKKSRKLLVSVINYYEKNKELDINSLHSKLVNDEEFSEGEFFESIRNLEKNKYIEFDESFQVIETQDGEAIILQGESIYKYLYKSCWLATYGEVIHAVQKYLDNKKLFRNLIIDLEYEIL